MKYNQTRYHGTKKKLRVYLVGVRAKAFSALQKEFDPQFKECKKNLEDQYGLTEFYETSAVIADNELKKLLPILDKLGENGVYAYTGQGAINLARNSGVANSVRNNIGLDSHASYQAIIRKYTDAETELNKAWQPIEFGILGQQKKIKYICRDLEEIGFDLTPYYEARLAEAQVTVPVINVDYDKLGIQ